MLAAAKEEAQRFAADSRGTPRAAATARSSKATATKVRSSSTEYGSFM